MSLLDLFRRSPAELPEHYVELVRRQGRIEAEVERLDLIWTAYRDELKRLVARLEKRDQRATEKKKKADVGEDVAESANERILARRTRHAVRRNSP